MVRNNTPMATKYLRAAECISNSIYSIEQGLTILKKVTFRREKEFNGNEASGRDENFHRAANLLFRTMAIWPFHYHKIAGFGCEHLHHAVLRAIARSGVDFAEGPGFPI